MTRTTPPLLHDVLGERFEPSEVAAVAVFGVSAAALLMSMMPGADTLPMWR